MISKQKQHDTTERSKRKKRRSRRRTDAEVSPPWTPSTCCQSSFAFEVLIMWWLVFPLICLMRWLTLPLHMNRETRTIFKIPLTHIKACAFETFHLPGFRVDWSLFHSAVCPLPRALHEGFSESVRAYYGLNGLQTGTSPMFLQAARRQTLIARPLHLAALVRSLHHNNWAEPGLNVGWTDGGDSRGTCALWGSDSGVMNTCGAFTNHDMNMLKPKSRSV